MSRLLTSSYSDECLSRLLDVPDQPIVKDEYLRDPCEEFAARNPGEGSGQLEGNSAHDPEMLRHLPLARQSKNAVRFRTMRSRSYYWTLRKRRRKPADVWAVVYGRLLGAFPRTGGAN